MQSLVSKELDKYLSSDHNLSLDMIDNIIDDMEEFKNIENKQLTENIL